MDIRRDEKKEVSKSCGVVSNEEVQRIEEQKKYKNKVLYTRNAL